MNNYFPKILITGGNGQLAQAILTHKLANMFHILALGRHQLDITNTLLVQKTFETLKPDAVIHAAAYTAVDLAEDNKDAAFDVNVTGTKTLSIYCQKYHIPIVHLSTDYVFSGEHVSPYHENDETKPSNYYGLTKALSEEIIRETCENYFIIRTSSIFSEFGHNFMRTMVKLLLNQPKVKVVNNQIMCPTYAPDLASVIFILIHQALNKSPRKEIYHFCGKEILSWYDFALLISQHVKTVTKIEGINSRDYGARAIRPDYSVLDCTKICNEFSLSQPSIKHSLSTIIGRIA